MLPIHRMARVPPPSTTLIPMADRGLGRRARPSPAIATTPVSKPVTARCYLRPPVKKKAGEGTHADHQRSLTNASGLRGETEAGPYTARKARVPSRTPYLPYVHAAHATEASTTGPTTASTTAGARRPRRHTTPRPIAVTPRSRAPGDLVRSAAATRIPTAALRRRLGRSIQSRTAITPPPTSTATRPSFVTRAHEPATTGTAATESAALIGTRSPSPGNHRLARAQAM